MGAGGLESQLTLSSRAELIIRIAISVILGLGVLYFTLIINTLRRYGNSMDKQFKKELELIARRKRQAQYPSHGYGPGWGVYSQPYPGADKLAPGLISTANRQLFKWFRPAKVLDFRFQVRLSKPMPYYLAERKLTHEKWQKFIFVRFFNYITSSLSQPRMQEAHAAWNGDSTGPFSVNDLSDPDLSPPRPQDNVAKLLEKWNRKYFQPRSTMGVLCHEYIDLFPDSPVFSIYIIDATPVDNQPIMVAERFGPVPEGLSRIDIFDRPSGGKKSTRRILGRTSIISNRNPLDGRVRVPDQEDIRPPNADSYPATQSSQPTSQPSHRPTAPTLQPSLQPTPSNQPDQTASRTRRPARIPSQSSFIDKSPPSRPSWSSDWQYPPAQGPATPTVPPSSSSPTEPTRRHDQLTRSPSPSSNHPNDPPQSEVAPQPIGPGAPNFHGGWVYVPPGAMWPGPLYPFDTNIPGPDTLNTKLWGFPPSGSARRSKTLSPVRPESGATSSRFRPLPIVSPDFTPDPWASRADMDTPNTYRTVTSSGIPNVNILPPSTQNSSQPGWTPSQYMSRIPGLSEDRAKLAELLSDNDPQQWLGGEHRRRSSHPPRPSRKRDSQSWEPPADAHVPIIAEPIPRSRPAPLPDVEGEGPDYSANIPPPRSTSTSYRAFSRFRPLPTVSPDYTPDTWGADMDTPYTYRTVTSSEIPNVNILPPSPSIQNPSQPAQYMSRIPGLSEDRAKLAELLSDNDPQQWLGGEHRRRSSHPPRPSRKHDSQSWEPPADAYVPIIAQPIPRARPAPLPDVQGEGPDHSVNVPRPQSTSTSYRSFSRSPPREFANPSTSGDQPGSSSNIIDLDARQSSPVIMSGEQSDYWR
ncbi:hypothetical protein C0991_004311 [Blastosporella zonata]|nr:hypothetical protein C0991_004311 [Blastosporella zonata]